MSVVTMKPGLLVSLKTSLEGGVRYTRTDLNSEQTANDPELLALEESAALAQEMLNSSNWEPEQERNLKQRVAAPALWRGSRAAVERWETVKVTEDPEEHKRATKVRGKVSSIIRSVCSHSAFGLLCPVMKEGALNIAIAEAREITEAFNASANSTRLSIYVLKGRIAESDSEAARAISGELRDLLGEMKEGIAQVDVEAIREAADKAKKLGAMLDEGAAEKVSKAIEEARAVAREITKKLTKKGEDVSAYVRSVQMKAIEEARFSFLDMEEPTRPLGEQMSLPAAAPRALDMESNEPVVKAGTSSDTEYKMVAAPSDIRKLDL